MNYERQLLSLIKATQALTSTRNLDEVLNLLIKEVLSVFDWADASVLFLYDSHNQCLKARSAVGFDMAYLERVSLRPTEGMSGKTFQLKKAQLFTSGTETSRGMSDLSEKNMEFYQKALGDKRMLPTSTICAPLITQGECFGVLTIDSFSEHVQFTDENLELLQTFANQAMIAIENATLISKNTRSNQIHDELTNVYMSHKDLAEITKTLSGLINRPVGVLNEFFDLLSYTDSCIQEVSNELRVHRWESSQFGQEQVHIKEVTYDVYLFSVKCGSEITGRLMIVTEKNAPLDSLDIFAIEQATTVFALELQSLNQQISNQFSHEGFILKELLTQPNLGKLLLEKEGLLQPKSQYIMLALEAEQPKDEKDFQLMKQFSRRLHRHLRLFPYKTLVYEDPKQYKILFFFNEKVSESEVQIIIKEIVRKLQLEHQQLIYAGLGRPMENLEYIDLSLRDSLKCIEFLKKTHTDSEQFVTYQELGVYRLFLNIDPQELESYYKMSLKKIVDYDLAQNTKLAETLELFLLYNQNMRQTAAKMFLHENTIKYRINSIKKLVGDDYLTGEKAFELYLAIKIRDYLEKSQLLAVDN
ncbi:helix-turn-helix domain-containing protein [Bacillus rubiinfantis]|uniref:helix-turn-helix domain-containing protein n=1 Tax=Bacillus rubiinfantis TaxID=1499680 RepID=UPI0005A98AB1|nr:helix-turn-helix domain-containing protein [Bacillus rubiinfantis]